MLERNIKQLLLAIFLLITTTGFLMGKVNDKDQEFVDKVGKRLLTFINIKDLNLKYKFPPKFEIVESEKPYAFSGQKDQEYVILIYTGLLNKIIQAKEDRLAYILAHEMSHITNCHVDRLYSGEAETPNKVFQLAFSREDEFEADREGFILLVKAGFSYKGAIEDFNKMRELYGDDSGIEAQGNDHPSWTERLAAIDKEKANIWRAMTSFNTGVELLLFEQYEAADVCFQKVTDEFSDSYEAWANRGYATLMRYFDAFDLEDLKEYNIGQIVIGGFYRRPESLEEKVKGVNEELWWKAIGYFNKALVIKQDLALVKANLGLAYLLDPRKKSLGEAEKYFSEAIEQIEKDTTLDPLQKAVIYLNSGNIGVAQSNYEKATLNLDKAYYYLDNVSTNSKFFSGKGVNSNRGISYNLALIRDAISLNRLLVKSKNFSNVDNPQEAREFLVKYLKNSNRASVWWHYSYTMYIDLCKKAGITPLEQSKFKNSTRIIPTAKSIVLQDGTPVLLSQKMTELNSKLNYEEKIPIVKERKFYKYIYPDFGIEIVGGETVIAIIIRNVKQAKGIKIPSFNQKKIDYSYWDLKFDDIKKKLKENDFEYCTFNNNDESSYLFCYDLGIAYLIEQGIVKGIIIVEPPRKS